jgi:hypothetical protein
MTNLLNLTHTTREGYEVNRKRVYRLYREERLMVRRRGGRERALGGRAPIPLPIGPNQRWSLDFVHDQMTDGRRFRIREGSQFSTGAVTDMQHDPTNVGSQILTGKFRVAF